MFPGDEDQRVLVPRLRQLVLQSLDLPKSELRIHRETELNRRRLDGGQGSDVVVELALVVDLLVRVGCEDESRSSELGHQDTGQRQGSVQSLATQLPQAAYGFLAVADQYNGFLVPLGCHRLGVPDD